MKKNILHISTIDIGGAGSSAYRFHKICKENGCNSKLLVKNKYLKDNDISGFRNLSSLFNRIFYKIFLNRKNIHHQLNTVSKYHFINSNETQTVVDTKEIIAKMPFKPDAIFIYWVSNFINARNIKELQENTGALVFWVLTDMGPLTGGCHYAWDCLGYTKDCADCKALENETIVNKKIAQKNLAFKINNLLNSTVTFITPTSILEKQFLKSSFNTFSHKKILLPFETEIFHTIEKKMAKKYFSIDEESKVIFIGCSDFNDERKGMIYLSKALQILKREIPVNENKIFLLIAGKHVETFIENLPFKHKYVGVLKSDEALCNAYSAAFIFACPSIEDSGPMMINESISCGTPVVAFSDVGVANDLIINGEAGYLANNRDEIDFAKGMKIMLELEKNSYEKRSLKYSEAEFRSFTRIKNTEELLCLINNQQ